jgi:8-oxo-dGTP diphosphatase
MNNLVLVVAVALIDDIGRIFVQQRPDGKAMAGLWEFPGGKVERGEIPEDALIRELNEELGIIVSHKHLQCACFACEPLEETQLLLLLYICREWSGEISAHEAPAIQWLHPRMLHRLPMPPADGPLIALLEKLIAPNEPSLLG